MRDRLITCAVRAVIRGLAQALLFGIGIAYPECRTDPLESGHYRIGLLKFMQRLKTVIPLWLRYST